MFRGLARQDYRNRYGSFAELANLPAELSAVTLGQQDQELLLHSECMYRVCSLIAFGLGLACFDDIWEFVDFKPSVERALGIGESEYDKDAMIYIGLTVKLPYVSDLFRNKGSRYLIKRQSDSDLLLSVNSDSTAFNGSIRLENINNKSMIVRCGISNQAFFTTKIRELLKKEKSAEIIRATLLALGQLIANEFARDFYIGTFNGTPLFEPQDRMQAAWHDLVTLKDKQLPGLCPVCGKVVDRWCGPNGGKPKITCCDEHSDAFQNERKRLQKTDDVDMKYSDKCAMKAREMRFRNGNDQRPLMSL